MRKRILISALILTLVGCVVSCGHLGETDNQESINVGVYDMYDLETYMLPIWEGRVVHNETVMFVGMEDEASLLFEAEEIVSVRSYDLKTEYKQATGHSTTKCYALCF